MTWKCKNPKCGRTFPVAARISTERKLPVAYSVIPQDPTRIIVDKPCCPFCESIEFEEVEAKKEES